MKRLIAILAVFAASCAPVSPMDPQAPALDLPVLEGARVPADCMIPAETAGALQGYDTACVVVSNERGGEILDAYVAHYSGRGFAEGGAGGPAMWLDRPAEPGCVQRLVIIANAYPPEAREQMEAVLWFFMTKNNLCGAATAAPW